MAGRPFSRPRGSLLHLLGAYPNVWAVLSNDLGSLFDLEREGADCLATHFSSKLPDWIGFNGFKIGFGLGLSSTSLDGGSTMDTLLTSRLVSLSWAGVLFLVGELDCCLSLGIFFSRGSRGADDLPLEFPSSRRSMMSDICRHVLALRLSNFKTFVPADLAFVVVLVVGSF